MNSISGYSESEDLARIGLFLFTGGIGVLHHDSLIQSRDIFIQLLCKCHNTNQNIAWIDLNHLTMERLPSLTVRIPACNAPIVSTTSKRWSPLQYRLIDHSRVLNPVEKKNRLT